MLDSLCWWVLSLDRDREYNRLVSGSKRLCMVLLELEGGN